MDPITMAVVGVAAQAIAGLIGRALASGDEAEAQRLIQQAAKDYNIPAEALAETLGSSALEGVKTDPGLRDAQMGAIDAFRESAQAGGLDPQAKAQLEEGLNAARGQEQSQRQAILDSYRRKGMGNSGFELAVQLQGASAGANRAHMAGVQAGGDAASRALDAWRQSAGLAGDLRGQDYGEQSNLANARDSIARFNLQNRQDMRQQTFDNRFRIAGAKYGAARDQAGMKQDSATATRDTWNGIGEAAGQLGSATSDYYAQQPKKKRAP